MEYTFAFANPGMQNGTQANTNYPLAQRALPGDWLALGANAVQAVQIDGTWLPMAFCDSVFAKKVANLPNTGGLIHVGSISLAPTMAQDSSQATSANDGVVLTLLRSRRTAQARGSVLATFSFLPGAWSATPVFQDFPFCYLGDGSGPLRLQLSCLHPQSQTFGGVVRSISIA